MKKCYLAFLLALCLCLAGTFHVFAEEPLPVTADELAAWAEELKTQALAAQPENDPADEASDVEGGILFLYPFAALYADGTEMTADAQISAVAVTDADEPASFRGAELTMTPGDLVSLFPNNNPDQAGTREGALLYLQETDDGALRYGRVYRDGQRVSAVEYGDLVPADGGYRPASLTFAFTDSLLSGIRAEGLSADTAPLMTAEERDALAAELNALASETGYRAVKSSRDGTELTAFGPEDLVFSGIDFLSLQPEDLPGTPESETIDNDDGTSLLRVDGDGYVAVFRTDAAGKTEIVSLSVEDDILEGPRCVRLGDVFHEDLQRFRFENREAVGNTEVLYGSETEVPRGVVEYGGTDGITLRYVTATPDGREAELLLRYTLSTLSEIILYIR